MIVWRGATPPSRRELRAIAEAWERGDLPDGAEVTRARANPAPSPAEAAYEEFHWGVKPRRRRKAETHVGPELFELGKLRAVEYEATKGNEHAIWVHHFSRPYPSLTATPGGRLGPIVGGRAIVTERGIER